MQQPWVLGLTGGIGSGKSAAAEHFSALGVPLIDADQAARQVVEPGRPALARIVERFGTQVLQADGQLDRAALRQQVFADASQRQWLEQLLHPLIFDEIEQFLGQVRAPYSILVSPLLIESGQHARTRRILVIDLPEALQIQRSLARDGGSEAQIRAILAAQLSREERLRHADDVLSNDQGRAELHQQVERLHRFYMTLKGGLA